MATTEATVLADQPLRRALAPAAVGGLLLLVLARLFGASDVPAAQTFTIIFTRSESVV